MVKRYLIKNRSFLQKKVMYVNIGSMWNNAFRDLSPYDLIKQNNNLIRKKAS